MEGLKEYILKEDAVAAVMETDPHVFLTYNKKKEKTDIVVAQITEEVLEEINKIPAADVVEVVRCCKCIYWDRDTIRHQGNDFRDWNEAECLVLAERDGYNEINRYTEADDFCSRGERKDG